MSDFVAKDYKSTTRISFANSKQADIVKKCLEVDEELQPTKIDKVLSVDGHDLVV